MRTAKVADCKYAKKSWSTPARDKYSFICVLNVCALEHSGSQKPGRKNVILSAQVYLVELWGLFCKYLIRLQSGLTLRPS